jgi:hypothetical protein
MPHLLPLEIIHWNTREGVGLDMPSRDQDPTKAVLFRPIAYRQWAEASQHRVGCWFFRAHSTGAALSADAAAMK